MLRLLLKSLLALTVLLLLLILLVHWTPLANSIWVRKSGYDLVNLYTPINSFISTLGILGIIITLRYQTKSRKHEQFETIFFNMLSIHNKNCRELTYEIPSQPSSTRPLCPSAKKETPTGLTAFQSYFNLLQKIYQSLTKEELNLEDVYELKSNTTVYSELEQTVQFYTSEEQFALPPKRALSLAVQTMDQLTNFALYPYFIHFYRTLKHAKENIKEDEYAKILRAQLSTYEFCLVYLNALVSDDKKKKNSVDSKLKELIQETIFFHNYRSAYPSLLSEFEIDNLQNYSDTAFREQTLIATLSTYCDTILLYKNIIFTACWIAAIWSIFFILCYIFSSPITL